MNARPYSTPPAIHDVRKRIEKHNPISGHRWAEDGDIIGYDVTGGGWMRTHHKTERGAEKELGIRETICTERILRGEDPYGY
jgi:hypothetical protein